jgi:hypothetical protein
MKQTESELPLKQMKSGQKLNCSKKGKMMFSRENKEDLKKAFELNFKFIRKESKHIPRGQKHT